MLVSVSPAHAEDLMEIYRKALDNDPQILAAGYEHSAAGAAVKEAYGRMLPQVGIEYDYSVTNQEIISSENPLYQPGSTEYPTKDYSLTLTQPLFDWTLAMDYGQARANSKRADAKYASKQQDLIMRTAEGYLVALAAIDELGFAEAEKAAVQKHLELVQGMMSSGMARKTELYDAKARYASVEADEISAQSNLDDKLQALREMVGELSGNLARLKAGFELVQPEPHDPKSWMQAALEQNPQIVQQLHNVAVSRYDIRLAQAGHLPTLGLTARFDNRDAGGSLAGGGNEVETRDVLIRVNIPLFQGGIVNSRTRRTQQLYQKALQDLTEMQRGVQRQARLAYHGIISAISKIEALTKSVSSQELALQSKQYGYRSGLYTNLDVLDAESDVFEARRDLAHARYDYLLNSLRLKQAVGTLSEADIAGINAWLQKGNE